MAATEKAPMTEKAAPRRPVGYPERRAALLGVVHDPGLGWAKRAACAVESGLPLSAWFKPTDRGSSPALEVCSRCPVRSECLADALRYEAGRRVGARFGVFGGMTPWMRVREEHRLINDASGG